MKKLLLFFVAILLQMVAKAETVEIDGIFYNLISKIKIAEVIKGDMVYQGNINIPETIKYEGNTYSVTSITEGAFESSKIESIVIGNNIDFIGYGAFKDCYSLVQVTFGNKLKTIYGSAFRGCSALKTIEIPSNVETIYANAFYDCHNLEDITFHSGLQKICSCAFLGCSKLRSVKIPGSVSSVEEEAFSGCKSLKEVIIEEGVEILQYASFGYCTELTSIYIPNSIESAINSFVGCQKLTSVYLPDLSICYYGRIGLFESQYNLYVDNIKVENIIVPDEIISISDYAFFGCVSLKTVETSNSVISIGYRAFQNCKGLTSVTIGNNVTSIDAYAFYGCSALTSVSIGNGINNINSEAFATCSELIDVYCYATDVPNTKTDAFKDSYIEYATLHVPTRSTDSYNASEPWNGFKEIVGIEMPKHKLIFMVDDEVYKSYEIEEGEKITPEPAPTKDGYTFSGWSETPEAMPAHDVTITGTFTINKYKLMYMVDGAEYKSYEVEYGATITPGTEPTKEGYTFNGWSEIPETMPAHDVTVTGTFSINSYKLTYMIDDKVYKEAMYEYGATITPEPQPEGDYATFEWIDLPQTMPAHDVVVYASYTSGIVELLVTTQRNIRIYSPNGKKLDKLQKGLNIVVLDDGTVKKAVVK